MNIGKLVRNVMIFVGIIGLSCLGGGIFLNVPILKSIGMLLGAIVVITWTVVMLILLFIIIKSSIHHKK